MRLETCKPWTCTSRIIEAKHWPHINQPKFTKTTMGASSFCPPWKAWSVCFNIWSRQIWSVEEPVSLSNVDVNASNGSPIYLPIHKNIMFKTPVIIEISYPINCLYPNYFIRNNTYPYPQITCKRFGFLFYCQGFANLWENNLRRKEAHVCLPEQGWQENKSMSFNHKVIRSLLVPLVLHNNSR